MPVCCVKQCSARKTKNQPTLSLHRFPANETLKRKWIENIGLDNINLQHKVKVVCSMHFDDSCFNRTLGVIRLRDGAVPSSSLLIPHKTNKLVVHERQSTSTSNCPIEKEFPDGILNKKYALIQQHQEKIKNITTKYNLQGPKMKSLKNQARRRNRKIDLVTEYTDPTEENTDPIEEYTVPFDEYTTPTEENTFSWQKPEEVVTIPEDNVEMEDFTDDVSMYVEDDCTSPRHDHDTTTKDCVTHLDKATPHEAFWCNVCSAPITGFRYTCVQCSDLDLCGACEADTQHSQHYVLRVPVLRPITEVQLVLATIRRHLMHKLDPINEPEQDCGDAVSVKSEVKSEVDSDDDAPEYLLYDDVSGSRTSSQASEYEYLDDDICTDGTEEIVISQHRTDNSCVSACETLSETKTTRKREMTIHKSDAPESDRECLPSIIKQAKLTKPLVQLTNIMKSNNKSSAQNTKDIIQTSDLQQPKALRAKVNEASEQSQIKPATRTINPGSQTFKQPKSDVIIVDGIEFNVPGEYIMSGCSVRVMKVPLRSQQYVGPNTRNYPHESNR